MSDVTSNPEAFARANAAANRSYLDSLTPALAARILERILDFGGELRRTRTDEPAEPPPPSCWPAVLIGRDEDDLDGDNS